MRAISSVVLALLLATAQPARAEVVNPVVKQGVGIAMIAAGILGGVLSYSLVLQNPSAPGYEEQRTAGWSSIGMSGAVVIGGVVALTVPPRSFFRRASITPMGVAVHF